MKLFALVLLAAPMFALDPVMFRGGPAHTGVYASPAPTLATMEWKFKTNGKIFSSPAIAGGVAYFGSSDHNLYAVRTADGTLAWKFRAGQSIASSPAVDNGLVYFTSLDGNFYALDMETGKPKWKFATGGERRFTASGIHGIEPVTESMPDPFDVFLSSPALAGGMVYFGSGDRNVYALDAKTGALQWKFGTGDVVHATPAIADGVVYIGSWDRNLYALNAASGAMLWKFQTGDDPKQHNQIGLPSSAAIVNGVVLFGCRDGHFYAVDAKTGQQKWAEDNHMGWVIASPAVQGPTVYFPTSEGTQFKAIDIASGKLQWRTVNKNISFSSPAIAGGLVYFGAHDGWLRALDLTTGSLKGEFQTEGSKQNASRYVDAEGKLNMPAIYPDSTLDGIIIGLDRMYSLGSILSSPVIVNEVVYFGSTDGYLYAVR
ncbi:MAG TPA: PQQ-binding-like beta-propeller repeat protein [Candidatus Acidoferrum sp.]|nr:PQQ-binding-like beta-propeller repeat protein [Candidatus Acidoferrum sp.]